MGDQWEGRGEGVEMNIEEKLFEREKRMSGRRK